MYSDRTVRYTHSSGGHRELQHILHWRDRELSPFVRKPQGANNIYESYKEIHSLLGGMQGATQYFLWGYRGLHNLTWFYMELHTFVSELQRTMHTLFGSHF